MRDRYSSGLRYLQFALRGVQLGCTVIVLAVYSYILATLSNRALTTPVYARVVEGISGIATLYIVCVCVLLRCAVGVPLTSFVTMFFDFAFLCCFVYVTQANRGGAGSCDGNVNTPFGAGDADTFPKGAGGGFTSLPKLRQACKLLSACMGVSIIAIFFFIFSMLVEVQLGRMRHREKRFGPGGLPPSKVEGGVANYGFAKWFHMYKGDDSLPSADGVQYGTVTEFDDGRPPAPEENSASASQQGSSQGSLPLVPVAFSRTSLPFQSQPGYYDAGYQGQQPQSFGPPPRSNTLKPPLLHRAGTMPLPEQMQDPRSLQRMESFPHPGFQRAESFAPVQRAMTENMSYLQPRRQNTDPAVGVRRTGSFPHSFQGEHVASSSSSSSMTPPRYQTSPPLPSQVRTGPALYPDTRFLRPDMRAQATGELPYPDNHPERIPFPGDGPRPGQDRIQMYPNYQYADDMYEGPR